MSTYREKYTNKLPYPSKDDFTMTYIYKNGKCVWEGSLAYYKRDGKVDGVQENVLDDEAYKTAMREYRLEDNRLYNAFKAELEEDHGVQNHPKKDLLFSIAWEEGHSCGYDEVASYYDRYVELIK